MSFHFYADYMQLYLLLKIMATNPLGPLVDCLIDIKAWMALNFLKLNETEAVIFGPHGGCAIQSIGLFPLEPFLKPSVKNLGVIMNKDLKMDQQINSVVRSSFFQLRLLSKVKSFLSFNNFEKGIHAFITMCLDYCNELFWCKPSLS